MPGDCTPHGIHPALQNATENYDVGLTGLSLLAFLGAGYTPASREQYDGINFGDVVRNAAMYLKRVQDGEGCVGPRDVEHYMYNHTIAALALSETYGMSGNIKIRGAAQRAIDFIVAGQNPGRGWRYIYQAGENDSSVTGWAVMALKSADMSGLSFDRDVAYDGARRWLDEVSYKVSGGTGGQWRTGYITPEKVFVCIPGVNDQFGDHPSMTAIAVMSRIFMDRNAKDPKVRHGALALVQQDHLPSLEPEAIDYYYWYYGSLALHQFTGAKGSMWEKWNQAMVNALLKIQNVEPKTDKLGSWEPISRWSCAGGRVYATAINALTLEVYYRYASVFGN